MVTFPVPKGAIHPLQLWLGFENYLTAMKYRRTVVRMMNGPRKPVSRITDRAKRYRANADDARPGPPKWCGFCGARRNVGVHHVNGRENDSAPSNLMWACKSCNARIANVLHKARLGKLTRQYNPARARKAVMDAYAAAIKVMRGDWPGDVSKAVQTIQDTPPDVRSSYTARTWKTRRAIYGPSGRQSEIPF